MKTYATTVVGAMRASISSAGATYDSNGLRNLFSTSMLVDEIRFYAAPNGSINAQGALIANRHPIDILNYYAVQFTSRGCPFSVSPVNIGLLCTDFQSDLEHEQAGQNVAKYSDAYKRWIPPHPIWMPPGDTLATYVVKAAGIPTAVAVVSDPVDVWIVLVGRVTEDPTPRVTPIPYILPFVQATKVTAADAPEIVIDSTIFRNVLTRPLQLQRIVARLFLQGATIGTDNAKYAGVDLLREAPDWCSIQITDSYGYKITPTWVPLGVFIDPSRAAWTFLRDLAPDGYLTIRFRFNAPAGLTVPSTVGVLPELALICSREETVR